MHILPSKRIPVFLLTVLFTCVASLAAQAQMTLPPAGSPAAADLEWSTLMATHIAEAPATLAERNFDTMTKKEWKALRKETLQALRSTETWEEATQSVIYLSTFYGDKINFNRASLTLYETYTLDREESHRILALAGLYAVGHEDTMRHVAQRVKLESSQRIRRLTLAALRAHFSGGTDIEVGPLRGGSDNPH